jgi:hypothetical protein
MAIKLENKVNTEAPSATYPFGNIKDNTGSNNGTPVDKNVYADFHQFFAKMMNESGIVYNDLPDNNTDGFQYFMALIKIIRTSLTYTDISSSIIVDSAFTTYSKKIKEYDDGTVDVEMFLEYSGSISSGSIICSGLPNKRLFAISARVSGGSSVQYVNLIKSNLSYPDRLYADQPLPNLASTNGIVITFNYKKS